MFLVFEGRFPREGIFVEPLKKGDVHEGAFIGELGGMEMEIGHTWEDEFASVIDEFLFL